MRRAFCKQKGNLVIKSFNRVFAIAVVLCALAFTVFPSYNTALAASPRQFSLSGSVTEIAGPSDYNAPGTVFLDQQKTASQQGTANQASTLQTLTNTRYYIIAGYSIDGTYHYPFHIDAGPGVHVTGVEVAINTQAHTQLLAVGIPNTSSSQIQPLASAHANAELRWLDPVNLELVKVWANLDWTYNGTTVTLVGGNGDDSWFAPSGWFANPSASHYNSSLSNSAWSNSHDGSYVNALFCTLAGDGPTLIGVNYVEVDGWNDGHKSGYYDTFIRGACAVLPHYVWNLT